MSSENKEDTSHRKKEFRCSLCRVTCLTDLSFLAHNRGARHLKALRSYRGRDYDQKTPKKLTSLKDFINDPDRNEPLIGLQYVEEGRKNKNKRHYRCTLCEHDMAMQVMFDHLIGHKHRRSYLNKHFPLLIKGVQTPTVAVLKTLAKEVEEEEGLQTYATNVPIKLQPHSAKKHSENASEQFSAQSDLLEPMLTDADDALDNTGNVLAMTGSLFSPWEPVPVYEENEENSSHKKRDSRSRSSSRERDHSSRRHRDHSSSRHKRSENSSKRRHSDEREHSSKRYKDHSPTRHKKRSSSREADYTSRRNRDRSPHHQDRSSSREADYKSKRDRNRSPRRYQKRSTSRETDHASRRDRDYSPPPQYQNPESSGKYSSSRESDSKRHRDSSPHHKSTTQPRSRDRKEKTVEYLTASRAKSTEESNSEKTYGSASHSSSGYSKDEDSARKPDSERRSGSGYSKNDKTTKTCDSSSHSSSEYSKVTEHQGSSGVQSSQSTVSAAAGGLSPDILKILQGKDVPTVTSILNRLSQYYPPLQNVDISLLVSVLFESGALK